MVVFTAADADREIAAQGTTVIIPEFDPATGQQVTSIAEAAFFQKGLTFVLIPPSITSIGDFAF